MAKAMRRRGLQHRYGHAADVLSNVVVYLKYRIVVAPSQRFDGYSADIYKPDGKLLVHMPSEKTASLSLSWAQRYVRTTRSDIRRRGAS